MAASRSRTSTIPGREARVEQRQQLVADAIARNRQIGIRRVLAKRDMPLAQKIAHVRARRLDERPHNDASARMHAAQAARPCAAQQTEEERLGLVVPRVGDGDRLSRRGARPRARKTRNARCAPRVRSRHRSRVQAAATSTRSMSIGISSPAGKVATEPLVGIRIGTAKLMVQMRRADDASAFGLGNLAKREQQRHRIGSARQRDSDTASGRKQSVTPDSATGRIDDAHHGCNGCDGATGAKRRGAKGAVSAPYAPTAPLAPTAPGKVVPVQGLEPRTTRI